MSIRDRLKTELTDAMKRKDRPAVSAYRTTLSAISNAEALPIETMPSAGAVEGMAIGVGAADLDRRELSEDDIVGIVRDEIDERRAEAHHWRELGRSDEADRLLAEVTALETLLT